MMECEGDVDLNQRKGKIITIYDVTLKLGWQGNENNFLRPHTVLTLTF